MALVPLARHRALDGDLGAGLASATEAARLFVDAGDLDFAAEAESMLAHINAALGRYAAAQESIERVDVYHAQVGLAPVAIGEPDLDAEVAAGLGRWGRFAESASRFLELLPPITEPGARREFLEGEPGNTSRVARMIPPTVRFLAAHGERDGAARLIAAMPDLARASTTPAVYASVGLLDSTARLGEELELPVVGDVLESPEAVFEAMSEGIRRLGPTVGTQAGAS